MLVSPQRPRWFLRAIIFALSFGLVFPLAPLAAAQQSQATNEHQLALYQQLQASLPAMEYSGEELGFELAFEDPATLLEYITDRIAFQSYRGILRGVDGTLASRAGNAFDQSLLLASLLVDAGYDAQLATATINEADAARLLTRLGETPLVGSELGVIDDAMASELLAGMGLTLDDVANLDLDPANSNAYHAARTVQNAFTGYLGAAPDANAELLEEAQMYAFVQYRLSSNDEWEALHPAFGTLDAPEITEIEHVFDGTIPDEFTHALTIEVLIERKVEEELELVPVTTAWTRPLGNMHGVPVEVSIVPMRDVGADAMTAGRYNESEFFIAQINQNADTTLDAFEMMGRTLPTDVAADPSADYFQTLGGVMNEATGLLGALGTTKEVTEPLALTGVVIRYTVSVPGGKKQTYERYVYDRITPENRASGEQLLPIPLEDMTMGMVQQHILLVNPGQFSDAYAQYALTDLSVKTLEALIAMDNLQARYDEAGQEMPIGEAIELLAPVGMRAHWPLLASLDAMPVPENTLSYRPEATIISAGTVTAGSEDSPARFVLDIIHNHRRVLTPAGDGFTYDQETAVLYGAWETALERQYVASLSSQPVHNALNMFDDGAPSFTQLVGNDADLSAVPLSARRAVAVDLANGYTVLYPDGAHEHQHWWRLDTATGELLGIGENGAGQSMVEYLDLLSGIVSPIINVMSALNGVHSCIFEAFEGSAADAEKCMKRLLVGTLVMTGLGGVLQVTFGNGIAGFLLLDVPTLAVDLGS